MSACVVCGGAAGDAYLCGRCVGEIRSALEQLPHDLADLEAVATRQARGPLGLGDPGREWREEDTKAADAHVELPARLRTLTGRITLPSTPWPFAPGAADLIWAVGNTVTTWTRHLAETRQAKVPEAREAVAWLVANVQSIASDEAAAQIHDEITSIPTRIDRAVVGRREATEFIGRCDLPDIRVKVEDGELRPEMSTCGADLYCAEKEDAVRCERCGAEYDVAEQKAKIAERVADEWARPHIIAAGLTQLEQPVKVDTLYKWIKRGHIKQVGIDDEGHPLYRVGDVQARVDLMRERSERSESA